MAPLYLELFAASVLCVLLLQSCTASFFEMEEPCAKAGGVVCATEDECPQLIEISGRGLCPDRQDDGAECCKTEPLHVGSCDYFLGVCVSNSSCADVFVLKEARDCLDNEVCCVLWK